MVLVTNAVCVATAFAALQKICESVQSSHATIRSYLTQLVCMARNEPGLITRANQHQWGTTA